MGNVVLGRVRGSGPDQLVVIKTVRSDLGCAEGFREMFADEARVLGLVVHPNVVRLLDANMDGDEPFLVFEYLEGRSLGWVQRYLVGQEGGSRYAAAGVQVVADMLAGLHHAHDVSGEDGRPLGVVHQDVSPANVFVTDDGEVRLLDFGVARARGQFHRVPKGMIKGRVAYMAPEVVQDGVVDRRTDVFSAGVVLWESIVGRRFWGDLGESDIIGRLVVGKLPAWGDEVDDPWLLAVCRRALAVDAERRFRTALEMRVVLDQWLACHAGRASVRALGAAIHRARVGERERVSALVASGSAAPEAWIRSISVDASELGRRPCGGDDASVGERVPRAQRRTGALDPTPADGRGATSSAGDSLGVALGLAACGALLGGMCLGGARLPWSPSSARGGPREVPRSEGSAVGSALDVEISFAGGGEGEGGVARPAPDRGQVLHLSRSEPAAVARLPSAGAACSLELGVALVGELVEDADGPVDGQSSPPGAAGRPMRVRLRVGPDVAAPRSGGSL
jgi:hypothetical protein